MLGMQTLSTVEPHEALTSRTSLFIWTHFWWVSVWFPSGVPSAPHSVLAIRDTNTSVLLQWQEPKDKDNILGYYMYYSETGKQDWKTVNNKPFTKNRWREQMIKHLQLWPDVGCDDVCYQAAWRIGEMFEFLAMLMSSFQVYCAWS